MIWSRNSKSPYLKPDRLPDLLAAIQAMAISPRYRLGPIDWADLISGDSAKGSYWRTVLDEHPEFFRASSKHPGQYALIWRRAGGSRYHRREGRILEYAEIADLAEEDRKFLSRPPVPEAQIKTLFDTAISLHKNAVDEYRDRRWLIMLLASLASPLASALGAVLGVRTSKLDSPRSNCNPPVTSHDRPVPRPVGAS
jgi:hypothetical protein